MKYTHAVISLRDLSVTRFTSQDEAKDRLKDLNNQGIEALVLKWSEEAQGWHDMVVWTA